MTESHEFESKPEVVDLLPIIHNDKMFQDIVHRIEEGSYGPDETLDNDLNTLRLLIGRQNFNKRTELRAFGWKENDLDPENPNISVIDSDQAWLGNISVFDESFAEADYRVMFRVDVASAAVPRGYERYIVAPSDILSCRVHQEQTMQIDVATQLNDLADMSYGVIAGHEYQTAWADKRAAILNGVCEEARQRLKRLQSDTLHLRVRCREYYQARETEREVNWRLARRQTNERQVELFITGRYTTTSMPEIAGCDLGKLNFPTEFAVSGGAPMIELYDETSGMFYFVPIVGGNVLDVVLVDTHDK